MLHPPSKLVLRSQKVAAGLLEITKRTMKSTITFYTANQYSMVKRHLSGIQVFRYILDEYTTQPGLNKTMTLADITGYQWPGDEFHHIQHTLEVINQYHV